MRALALFFALVASTSVLAQTAAPPANWRSMTKEQLNALSPEQIGGLPIIEVVEKTDPNFSRAKMEPIVASVLSRLMYAMDKPVYPFPAYLDAAVREFQAEIGAKVDGQLKFREMDVLKDRVGALDRGAYPIYPPFKLPVYVNAKGDYATFGGTWVIEGDRHAFPANFTKYKCYKDDQLCYTSEGYLSATAGSGSGSLQVESGFLKIIKWDASELLMEDNVECRVSTISVNFKTKDVIMITRNKDTGCNSLVPIQPLATPRISRLVDGFQEVSKLNQAQSEANQKGFSKRFQEIVKTLKN
jgi:hypothetical protein